MSSRKKRQEREQERYLEESLLASETVPGADVIVGGWSHSSGSSSDSSSSESAAWIPSTAVTALCEGRALSARDCSSISGSGPLASSSAMHTVTIDQGMENVAAKGIPWSAMYRSTTPLEGALCMKMDKIRDTPSTARLMDHLDTTTTGHK